MNDQFPDRLVVTWLLQQEFCGFDEGCTCISDNTIQLILFADGRIQFIYGGVTSRDAIVGITPGGVAPILEVDFSTERSFSTSGQTTILQQFTTPDPMGTTDPPGSRKGPEDPFDLDGQVIVFSPNGSRGYDVEVTQVGQPLAGYRYIPMALLSALKRPCWWDTQIKTLTVSRPRRRTYRSMSNAYDYAI